MITLKTLPQATAQEVFNQVARHLLKQNAKSVVWGEETRCKYRHEGMKCAAGCLIGDDEYLPYFEGRLWDNLANTDKVPNNCVSLIGQLQKIHDEKLVKNWERELKKLAASENLNWNL